MSLTPLIDELTELGPDGIRLLVACEEVVRQAHAELRLLEKQARRELLDQRVADFFAANPDASANAAWRAIGGNKADVLDAVTAVRSGTTGPEPRREVAA